jgi:hypothetical protein
VHESVRTTHVYLAAHATPSDEEITRVRRLIGRINAVIAELTHAERAAIDEAVTAVRRHRTVMLGMPAVSAPLPAIREEANRMTARTPRQRVITALSKATTDGGIEISVAAVARTAVDRSFLYRHRDLLEKIHALETAPPGTHSGGPAVSRASLQADLLAAQERAARMHARITQLERRLSELLGEQAWHDSGLGAPAEIDALSQRITHLEQAVNLRLQIGEREQDLAAARAANRELMAQLNTATRGR